MKAIFLVTTCLILSVASWAGPSITGGAGSPVGDNLGIQPGNKGLNIYVSGKPGSAAQELIGY